MTPILQLADEPRFLVGDAGDWPKLNDPSVRPIFDRAVVEFLNSLSKAVFSDAAAQQFPDVMAFALWCRGSALEKQKADYADGHHYLGRGLVFHVSPANTPVMFAYSLALGLLSGNSNVVRLPSREFAQVDYLCGLLDRLTRLPAHRGLRHQVACIRYPREQEDVTRLLSELCDVRVIWGGDSTVDRIRRSPLRAGAYDLTFPDRYSIAVIDSAAWLNEKDKERYVGGFYNDTYLNDQSSCSSPRLVFWLGGDVAEAQLDFWTRLEALVRRRYRSYPAQTVGKLEFAYGILARDPDCRLCSTELGITRIWSDTLRPELLDDHPGGGVFVESAADRIEALLPILQRRCQTISYFGVSSDEIVSLLCAAGARGGDRVVPMGQTLDFTLTWDGHDTIRALSRKLGNVRPALGGSNA